MGRENRLRPRDPLWEQERRRRGIETAEATAQVTGDTVMMHLVVFMIMLGGRCCRKHKTEDGKQMQADHRPPLSGKLRSKSRQHIRDDITFQASPLACARHEEAVRMKECDRITFSLRATGATDTMAKG